MNVNCVELTGDCVLTPCRTKRGKAIKLARSLGFEIGDPNLMLARRRRRNVFAPKLDAPLKFATEVVEELIGEQSAIGSLPASNVQCSDGFGVADSCFAHDRAHTAQSPTRKCIESVPERISRCYSRNFPSVTFSLLHDELLLC